MKPTALTTAAILATSLALAATENRGFFMDFETVSAPPNSLWVALIIIGMIIYLKTRKR